MRRGWEALSVWNRWVPWSENPALKQPLHIRRFSLADALSSPPTALGRCAGPGPGAGHCGYLAVGNSDAQPVSRVNLFRAPHHFPGVRSLDHRITPLERCRGVQGLKLLLQTADLELG